VAENSSARMGDLRFLAFRVRPPQFHCPSEWFYDSGGGVTNSRDYSCTGGKCGRRCRASAHSFHSRDTARARHIGRPQPRIRPRRCRCRACSFEVSRSVSQLTGSLHHEEHDRSLPDTQAAWHRIQVADLAGASRAPIRSGVSWRTRRRS
jgi:hypothetical protein